MKRIISILLVLFCAAAVFAQDNTGGTEQENTPVTEVESSPPQIKQEPVNTPVQSPQQTPAVSEVKVSGDNKISLEIKGMEVTDVLKMLAARAGLNIVIGKNVTGRATLFLKDVQVRDAFDIVISSNELAYEQKGDIINVMTQRDYELLYGERFQDRKQTRIIPLKYFSVVTAHRLK